MATKVKENEEAETEREGTQDGPLLDLSDDAVKKMIKAAKKRGYVTMDELNSVLPSEEVTSEQIEDTMAMLSDMGINVVEDDEAEEATADDDDSSDDNDGEGGEIAPASSTALASGSSQRAASKCSSETSAAPLDPAKSAPRARVAPRSDDIGICAISVAVTPTTSPELKVN